eukprot:9934507-Lingulodinium_polyedra.AAC.1
MREIQLPPSGVPSAQPPGCAFSHSFFDEVGTDTALGCCKRELGLGDREAHEAIVQLLEVVALAAWVK